MPKTISFTYLNHNCVESTRTIDVESLEFNWKPGYGYQPGWAISGFDHGKKARRTFLLSRIVFKDTDYPPQNFVGNFVITLIRM